jgi:hypothetical protein
LVFDGFTRRIDDFLWTRHDFNAADPRTVDAVVVDVVVAVDDADADDDVVVVVVVVVAVVIVVATHAPLYIHPPLKQALTDTHAPTHTHARYTFQGGRRKK